MGLNVYFHSHQLTVSSKNERSFFEKCFDASVDKISRNMIADPSSEDNIYKKITCGELILKRSEIFKSVKTRLIDILSTDWAKILDVTEIDKFSDNLNELHKFKYWEEIYVDPKSWNKGLKPKVKVICFKSDLSEIFQKFILKTLE